MCLAVALIVCQEAVAKYLGQSLPMLLIILPFSWETPAGWQQWTTLVMTGIDGGAAHGCIIAAIVAPFMSSQIFWALVLGYLFFGASPAASPGAGSCRHQPTAAGQISYADSPR